MPTTFEKRLSNFADIIENKIDDNVGRGLEDNARLERIANAISAYLTPAPPYESTLSNAPLPNLNLSEMPKLPFQILTVSIELEMPDRPDAISAVSEAVGNAGGSLDSDALDYDDINCIYVAQFTDITAATNFLISN